MFIPFAFDLKQVRHALIRQGRIRAEIFGRMFDTVETELGRAAIAQPEDDDWLTQMGIKIEPLPVLQARAEAVSALQVEARYAPA